MNILASLKEILLSPINDPSMLWEIIPILATIIVIEMYFGRYKHEEMGWNSALSNALVLIYVGTNLLHFLYLEDMFSITRLATQVALGIAVIGLIIAFLDFHHILPKELSFGISSILPVNFIAILAIIFVHGNLKVDSGSAIASLILFVLLLVIIKIVQAFEKERIDT